MPETANAGLITLSEGRDEAAVLASAAVDGPYTGPAPAARRQRRQWGWYRLISPVAVVALWQLLSSAGLIPADKLPPPTTVWHTAVSLVTTNSPAYGTLQGAMLRLAGADGDRLRRRRHASRCCSPWSPG